MKTNKHWTAKNARNFMFRIGADFVSQILDNINSQNELVDKLRISKGRVSQTLNNPGNMTLETMVKYAQAINMKVAVVIYDKDIEDRPVHSKIFYDCWVSKGYPRDAFELAAQQSLKIAINGEGKIENGNNYICASNTDSRNETAGVSFTPQQATTLKEIENG